MTDNGNKNNNKNITNDLSNNKLLKQIYNKNQLLLKNKPYYNNYNNRYKKNNLNLNMSRKYPYNIKDSLDLHNYRENTYWNNNYNKKWKRRYQEKKEFKELINDLNEELEKNMKNLNTPFFLPTYQERDLEKGFLNIPPPLPKVEMKKVNIRVEINTLDDILKLIDDYPIKHDTIYNIDMKAIHNIKQPITDLNNMIGMQKLKNNVINQILYFIQKFHINHENKKNNSDFMHTVIYGPPGTGKTEIAKILGSVFSNLGVLRKNYFKKVTRSDLIAGYLGQTAIKTTDVIKKSLGGVLFIDEAYALGNSEKRDSFAKECIDTLCEALSDHKENLMVIIAGYENDLNKCFFSYNQGLDSRFTWRFKTDDYTSEELFLIFKKKVNDIGWTLKKKIKYSWFEDKMDYFKYFGRDMETLLAKVKIAHSKRVFCLDEKEKRIINLKDMNNGYDLFIDNDEVKKRGSSKPINYMYC